jgi:hypothetical protein
VSFPRSYLYNFLALQSKKENSLVEVQQIHKQGYYIILVFGRENPEAVKHWIEICKERHT